MPIDERDITLTENGRAQIPTHYISTVIDKTFAAAPPPTYSIGSTRFSLFYGDNPSGDQARHECRVLRGTAEIAQVFVDVESIHFTTDPDLWWRIEETGRTSNPLHSGTVATAVTPTQAWTHSFTESGWTLNASIGFAPVSGFSGSATKTLLTNGVRFNFTIKAGAVDKLRGTAIITFDTAIEGSSFVSQSLSRGRKTIAPIKPRSGK